MKIFLDTADLNEIRKAVSWGIIDGVTTNPTLFSKQKGFSFEDLAREILNTVDGPVSLEVVSDLAEDMVKEARNLNKLGDNVVVKIPFGKEGLKAVRALSSEGIKTNVTLVFSPSQALLAAKAGATYVSIFLGRLDDISNEAFKVLADSVEIFRNYDFRTEIIAASIRHPMHVVQAALIGTDIATVPFAVLEKMFKHPLTDVGIERFKKDWEQFLQSAKKD